MNLIPLKVAQVYGKTAARKFFRERGNHSEVHLSEPELAAMLTASIAATQHDFELKLRKDGLYGRC